MSLYCYINICVRLLTAGWYVVLKGKIPPFAFFFCVKADGLEANKFHPTIKFTAKVSENEITFRVKVVLTGERFKNDPFWIKTHYKPIKIFQYTHVNSCHASRVENCFIEGEAMRLFEHLRRAL
mgnify:CR=1 FL=1